MAIDPPLTSPPTATLEPGPLRRAADILRTIIAVVAVLTLAGSLGIIGKLIIDPNGAEEFTVSRRPVLYNAVFDNSQREFPESVYEEVLGSAHNSGGRIEATLEAIIFGADVIEADVVDINGQLYAGHAPPLPLIGDWFFRGPNLEQVWTASYRADAFKLDLKETSPAFVDLVVDFITTRFGNRTIIVASRSPEILTTLRERAPETVLLLSVHDDAAFERLQHDEALQQTIDGITVRDSLIDIGMMTWLQERELGAFAWTVNDIERVNELVRMGVDGITTENLAILSLLGGQSRSEPQQLGSTPVAASEIAEPDSGERGQDNHPGETHLDTAVEYAHVDQHEIVGDEKHHEE